MRFSPLPSQTTPLTYDHFQLFSTLAGASRLSATSEESAGGSSAHSLQEVLFFGLGDEVWDTAMVSGKDIQHYSLEGRGRNVLHAKAVESIRAFSLRGSHDSTAADQPSSAWKVDGSIYPIMNSYWVIVRGHVLVRQNLHIRIRRADMHLSRGSPTSALLFPVILDPVVEPF